MIQPGLCSNLSWWDEEVDEEVDDEVKEGVDEGVDKEVETEREICIANCFL